MPADDKKNARLIISQILLDTLRQLKLEYPKVTDEQQQERRAMRKLLAKSTRLAYRSVVSS